MFIFDEPTRGVDVNSKAELYNVMCDLADQGKAIILISSDMPELIALSDRVLVMRDNRFVAELSGNEITEENSIYVSKIFEKIPERIIIEITFRDPLMERCTPFKKL